MKLILCVDIDNGMTFNDRRQSRDREVIKDIVRYVGEGQIFISEYSRSLFESANANILVSNFGDLDNVNANVVVFDFDNWDDVNTSVVVYDFENYCFVEKIEDLNKINWNKIDELTLYRWDKKYPTDYSFDIDKDMFILNNALEFKGYSHDRIIREVYKKNER